MIGALALHGLALLVHARHVPLASQREARLTPQEVVEFDETSIEPPASPPPASEARLAPESMLPASPSAHTASRASTIESAAGVSPGAQANSDLPSTGDVLTAPASTDTAQASNEVPARKIDLGLDGTFFMRPSGEVGPRAHKSAAQRSLEAALSNNDVQHGLARGNALLGSLNSAAREAGPLRGEALVRVTVGPDGSLSEVELVQGAASDWGAVLRSFRELATRKRVRVPPGSRGVRVSFSVKAKVQRPSGKEAEAFPIGTADPSLKPNGMTLNGDFDLADLAGGAQRLVYARVVSEEIL